MRTSALLGAIAVAGGFAFAASLVDACGGHLVNLGTNRDGGGPQGDDTTNGDGGAAAPGSLSGTYTGYIEAYTFPDGSDTVVMSLTFADDGTVTGTVVFGDSPLLAPPTNPDVAYPPGYGSADAGSQLEGFAFTVLDGTYAAPRLTLRIDAQELWKAWCGIQTTLYPQYQDNSEDGGCGPLVGYSCAPDTTLVFSPDGGTCQFNTCGSTESMSVDCDKLGLCNTCTCTATGCTVVPGSGVGPGIGVSFDMRFGSGGALDGSEIGISGAPIVLPVHLARQP